MWFVGSVGGMRRATVSGLGTTLAGGLAVALLCGPALAQGGPPYDLYFGDLHTHTAVSDGSGTPAEAYAAAIAAGADFMAITEHDSYGFYLTQEEWEELQATAAAFTSRHFVAMAGYEFWLAGSGEVNVFNTPDFPPIPEDPEQRPSPGSEGDPDVMLPALYDWLAEQPGAVGQWNHPTYVSQEFRHFAHWSEQRDRGMNVIEVWNDSWFYTEESYVEALDAGWHVMPAANADNHTPDWIAGLPLRTVLLARRLTPENLYEAMSARRGYATVDPTVVEWSPTLTSDTARYYYVRVTTESNEASVLASRPGSVGITAVTAPVWTGR